MSEDNPCSCTYQTISKLEPLFERLDGIIKRGSKKEEKQFIKVVENIKIVMKNDIKEQCDMAEDEYSEFLDELNNLQNQVLWNKGSAIELVSSWTEESGKNKWTTKNLIVNIMYKCASELRKRRDILNTINESYGCEEFQELREEKAIKRFKLPYDELVDDWKELVNYDTFQEIFGKTVNIDLKKLDKFIAGKCGLKKL